MIKKLILILLLAVSKAAATTTLQFSISGIGATNFANASSVATNGMRWGVIISSTNATFAGSSVGYDPFNQAVSGFLTVGGIATDDYYFANGAVTTSTLGAPFFSGVEAGSGAITTANNVPTTGDGITNVAAGDPFALIWMPSSTANLGDKYGLMANASFVLPASGITAFTNPFIGADPLRPATFTFTSVPEPSKLILFGFGLCCLTLRRNRK